MSHSALGTPKLKQIGKGKWRLEEPFTYVTLAKHVPAKNRKIIVPAKFETDGASSLGLLIKPWGGHYPVAALVHDWLYVRLNGGRPHPAAITRREADLIFREILRRSKVRPLVRLGMFIAVRALGGKITKRLFVR